MLVLLSNFGLAQINKGSFFQNDIIKIGEVVDIEIQVVYSKDVVTGENFKMVRMKHSITSSDPRQWSLDINTDEINEVISAMQYICNKVFPVSPDKWSDYSYKNKANLEIGCYAVVSPSGILTDWRGFINNTDYLRGGEDNYTQAHFAGILSLLEQAKLKL